MVDLEGDWHFIRNNGRGNWGVAPNAVEATTYDRPWLAQVWIRNRKNHYAITLPDDTCRFRIVCLKFEYEITETREYDDEASLDTGY